MPAILLAICLPIALGAQVNGAFDANTSTNTTMTVEIWSDMVCPFCYIGKRRFEQALAQFENRDAVQIVWRSFQLDPDLISDPNISAAQSLSEKKGWSAEQAADAMRHVTQMAEGVGLQYRFDKAVVANTFDAHRFAHFAKQHGKQNEAEEKVFAAYFSEGKNIADHSALSAIAEAIGLDAEAAKQALATNAFADDVKQDIALARQFGISGVPFFVFDRKYAVSGAQETSVFLQTLHKAWEEARQQK
jgi:predicted DsbA family dithiol-disulfide isomerase